MPTVAQTGLVMTLHDAQRLLVDHKGKSLNFIEQKDGSWNAEDIEGDKDKAGNVRYTYRYSLVPQTTMVTVSVSKVNNEEEKKAKEAAAKKEEQSKPTYSTKK